MTALLLALLLAATGIDRAVDPELTAIAERRAVEIQADFSHADADPCCAEVIAWNSGAADPVAHVVDQWRGSPPHWAILTDPSYGAIGCAVSTGGARTYAVCVLAAAATEQPAPAAPAEAEPNSGGGAASPSGAPSTSATPPPAPLLLLPDTSAANGEIRAAVGGAAAMAVLVFIAVALLAAWKRSR